MTAPTVMTDHPGWIRTADGVSLRAVTDGRTVSVLTTNTIAPVDKSAAPHGAVPTRIVLVDPAEVHGSGPAVEALRLAGPVARVANPSLWDAVATAIVRQVIRAEHARTLYRRFAQMTGPTAPTTGVDGLAATDGVPVPMVFPAPEQLLALPDSMFADLGMAFKRPALQAAAEAFGEHGPRWAELGDTPHQRLELITELMNVRRIGPWTAGAAVADYTNDFSLYPYADLAVRTWAGRMAPEIDWPGTEPEFGARWRKLADSQLSEWTLLTLAWGGKNVENATVTT